VAASLDDLEAELERLSDDGYCADGHGLIESALSLLLPPERISTTECAARYRYIRSKEGRGRRKYDVAMTPYMVGPQDALDDMEHRFVVVVGPGRTGKSVGGENHLFKRLRNGPLTDCIIYLQADSDIASYADKEFNDFFDLHPEIMARLGPRPTDRKREFKRVSGRTIQLLPANPGNVRQKEATFIWASELDGYRKSVRDGFKDNIGVRMAASGNQAKAYIESHPDLGWTGGVAAIWKDSTRGLWFWPCGYCGDFSSPHPLAPKGMHMPLDYDRDDKLGEDGMLDRVEESAHLACPHCGGCLTDEHKAEMLAGGKWVFAGQTIEPDGTVHGEPRRSDTAGFWIHGAMSPFVPLGELARKYVAALVFFERTRKPERLKEVVCKSFGEVYEGAGSGSVTLSPEKLKERAVDKPDGYLSGTIPDGVLYLTAAIDMGRRKADVKIKGWDLEARSWVIARETIVANATGEKLDFYNRQSDWLVLRDKVLRRIVPFADDPAMGLPIAGVAIDNSDGHVTHRAREFARQMLL
jgi:phage terminase large subunit GpA-like protein